MAIKIWAKGLLTLEADDGSIITWFPKCPYELEKYEENTFAIECHFNKTMGFITLGNSYIPQILELFVDLKVCPHCDQYMPKDYEYCFWCSEWTSEIHSYTGEDKDRTRGIRKHKERIKRTYLINLYKHKKGSEHVENWMQNTNASKLRKWKLKCDCDYCKRGVQHSSLKRETRVNEYLNEYRKGW